MSEYVEVEEPPVEEEVKVNPDPSTSKTKETMPQENVCETPNVEACPKNEDKGKKQQTPSKIIEETLQNLTSPEEKIVAAVAKMKESLETSPYNFRDFWDLRNWVLAFLKNVDNPLQKSTQWEEISHLTQEARRLKEIVNQETNFTQEQIEKAIKALEVELDATPSYDTLSLEFPEDFFEQNQLFYKASQGELDLLNTYAQRVNALRKELLKTPIRSKMKNELFDRLSNVGDKIFPRRKGLIQEVSDSFVKDISSFCQELKDVKKAKLKLVTIREGIKELQKIAKLLTLNTYAFNHTRVLLSDLWDKVKHADKERKKELSLAKDVSKQALSDLLEEVAQLTKEEASEHSSFRQVEHKLTEILKKAKSLHLDRGHFKELKEAVDPIRQKIEEKVQKENEKRQEREAEKEKERQANIEAAKSDLLRVKELLATHSISEVEKVFQEKKGALLSQPLHRREKIECDRCIKEIQDALIEKREEALLNLPDDAKETLQNLNEVLVSRKKRRKEIKQKVEEIRKTKGATGLDFEQALHLDDLLQQEKNALDALNEKIKEIEAQIAQVRSQI